jgi:hypothetical protein
VEKHHPFGSAVRALLSSHLWTPTQRRSVLILSMFLLIFLAVEFLTKPAVLTDPLPQDMPRAQDIQDRLDPNISSAEALSAIPELGEKRALEIVAYRENFELRYPGHRAFTQPEDLVQIKGIGLATIENLRPYLLFPPDHKGPH